ncbi:ABC transporter permease [Spirosoma humi]
MEKPNHLQHVGDPSSRPPRPGGPRWATQLLIWWGDPNTAEEVQGDLLELYAYWVETQGKRRADWRYCLSALKLLRPLASSQSASDYAIPFSLNPDMIRNYFKIAWRNLAKNKLYTGINIFGLALGMACALLIGLWVHEELNYDRFLPDVERVFFVRVQAEYKGEVGTNYATPGPLQEAIASEIPQVAAATKTNWGGETLIKVGEKATKEFGRYATADFFRVFELPAIDGDPKTALAQPDQIVITQKLAEKFFPQGQARGKVLQLDNDKFYKVGAVIENIPANSTIQFEWMVNWKVQEKEWMENWGNNSFLTYLRLKPNTTATQAEAAMKNMYPRHAKRPGDADVVQYPILHPMTDVHLYSEYKNGKVVGGGIEYVRIFSIVALFILLIACINFMNLATARSSTRAREVGVRKVVGAMRPALIGQFLSESLLTSLLAAVLAVGLVWLVLPTFNQVFDKQIALSLSTPVLWLGLTGLVMFTGFLSGSYPALFLSGLKAVRILKGNLQFGSGPATFRRVLVVVQFALSVFLIVGMLAVGRQMNYLQRKHLGLDRENVVYVPMEGEIANAKNAEVFRQEVTRLPSVAAATAASDLPINVTWTTAGNLTWAGKDPTLETNVSAMLVGGEFTRTMNIKLLGGRDFRPGSPADSSNYLVNEATAKLMGIENPVGKEIEFSMGKGRIIGLMKDFHLNSLHQAISPLVVCFGSKYAHYILVRTRAGQTAQAIADLEQLTKRFNSNYPFTYHFLDEAYGKLYRSEQQVSSLVNYFGVLAILISCLGLFGLVAFTAEQRTKEIGIRKVLGASIKNIIGLLSADFLRLVLIALALATPVAWWAVDKWLKTFEYRQELTWWIVALAGLLAVGIALLTVSFQSIKAALMNPVKSLRNE